MNHVSIATDAGASFPWKELIAIVPDLIWLVAIAIFLWLIGFERIKSALSRATKIGIAGLQIELKAEVEAAGAAKSARISDIEAGRAARRLAAAVGLLSGARLLWVDDNPGNNKREIETLRSLNVAVDLAESTSTATMSLQAGAYDIVVSDMTRGDNRTAGLDLIPLVARAVPSPYLIYYVGVAAPTPVGSFGLTTRPDELYHLIVDALSRKRS